MSCPLTIERMGDSYAVRDANDRWVGAYDFGRLVGDHEGLVVVDAWGHRRVGIGVALTIAAGGTAFGAAGILVHYTNNGTFGPNALGRIGPGPWLFGLVGSVSAGLLVGGVVLMADPSLDPPRRFWTEDQARALAPNCGVVPEGHEDLAPSRLQQRGRRLWVQVLPTGIGVGGVF